VYITVDFYTYYESSEEYYTLIIVVGSIGGALLLLTLFLACRYKKHKRLYAELAEERRKHKEQMLKAKIEIFKV